MDYLLVQRLLFETPISTRIRENQRKSFPSEKSGNCNTFCRESGKVRENDLAELNQIWSLVSRHIFVNTQMITGKKLSLLRSQSHAIPVRSVPQGQGKSGKMLLKCQGKSGNSRVLFIMRRQPFPEGSADLFLFIV